MSSKTKLIWLSLIALAGSALAHAEIAVGSAFPSFQQYKVEGVLPSDMSGKVVVVDFWASWCAPCRASFPALSELQKEFDGKVVVLGISVDEKKSAYDQFLGRYKPAFSTVRDGEHRLTSDVRVPTMPTSYVIDRNGKVRFLHAGFHRETPAALRVQIKQLLEEKS